MKTEKIKKEKKKKITFLELITTKSKIKRNYEEKKQKPEPKQ
jgi:hypothetical protein